jgi:hypothetical protein
VVTGHDRGAAQQDLAGLARGHVAVVLVDADVMVLDYSLP